MYEPKNDGIDHINAYSKSLCELGRLLTNFAHTPFEHPQYGRFESVEGAWYFGKLGFVNDEFKKVHGYNAKKLGQKMTKSLYGGEEEPPLPDHFKNFIKECISCKLRQNVDLLNKLVSTNVPIVHYYFYGDPNQDPVVKNLDKYNWVTGHIEEIRKTCQQHLKNKKKKGFKIKT